SPDGLRLVRVHIVDGQERELSELRMDHIDYVRLAGKGFNPRLRIALGYNTGTFGNPDGGMMSHFSVELAALHVLISPRLTVGFTIGDYRLPKGIQLVERLPDGSLQLVPNVVTAHEGFAAVGLAAAYPWERLRYFLALGAGFDLGIWWQSSQGQTESVVAF